MRIIVALGGNALLKRGAPMTAEVQGKNVKTAAQALAPVANEHQLVISHGNGPQVGLIALQQAAYTAVEPYPLDVLGAQTEGMIAYMIEQELGNLLPFEVPFATLLTIIEVDANDPAFQNPTKLVGPVYDKAQADALAREKKWVFKQDGDKWRRVVPRKPSRLRRCRPPRRPPSRVRLCFASSVRGGEQRSSYSLHGSDGMGLVDMNVLDAAAWGALAAASLLVGAVMALRYAPPLRITGLIMGFGAGALVSAIAYELVPESLINADWQWVVAFATGAIAFYIGDAWIDRRGGKERKSIDGTRGEGAGSAIFLGTLLDGIPESLIMGMGFAMGGSVSFAFLVAVFVSNIPEGVAGTVSLKSEGRAPTNIYRMWVAVVIASAVGAAIGYALVVALPNVDGSYAKAFAAGAMLTMLADAMMPEAFEHGGRTVGLVTVMGFLAAATLSALE